MADLMRRGLSEGDAGRISHSAVTGLPVVHLGTVITTEDVRALDDEDA